MKLNFVNDYSSGAHERILKTLVSTNFIDSSGYGEDDFSNEARILTKKKFACKNADVYFIPGGTQTNLIAISHTLKPYEAVIACSTGHIAVHETGAIEATGHKVIEVKGKNYKITPEEILFECQKHSDHHMVKPKMVYISNSTEMGTVYTREELIKISEVCQKNRLFLYLDGARMASALTSEKSDITAEDYAKYCDMFYIGGTKCGLLLGEALIINNEKLKKEIKFSIKQKGALLAKGKLLGIQFLELFKGNFYEEIGKYSNEMAKKISSAFVKKGFELLVDGGTNQVFVKMNDEQIEKLSEYAEFSTFPPENINDSFKIVRFVTAWSTQEKDVEKFAEIINKIY